MSLSEAQDYRVVFGVSRPCEPPKVAWKLVAPTILRDTARDHGIPVRELLSKSRVRKLAYARFDAITRLRAVRTSTGAPRFSFPAIGRLMGGLDHTSCIHGVRRWAEIQAERGQ